MPGPRARGTRRRGSAARQDGAAPGSIPRSRPASGRLGARRRPPVLTVVIDGRIQLGEQVALVGVHPRSKGPHRPILRGVPRRTRHRVPNSCCSSTPPSSRCAGLSVYFLHESGRYPCTDATSGPGSRGGGRRVCHGAPATSAPVDHASRTGWGRTALRRSRRIVNWDPRSRPLQPMAGGEGCEHGNARLTPAPPPRPAAPSRAPP